VFKQFCKSDDMMRMHNRADFLLVIVKDQHSLLLCTEDDNSSCRNVCKMSVVSFALAVIFIIRLFSTSVFRVPNIQNIQ